ncbi:MAG: carboxymuconolactone decarboxylase family protein [Pseudomonadales bacterium]|jgi:alkylhydroperoxidase/carboxymuconolactone decarboxylase family protein YurZ|nr:carboxymuconolactone decarboxylase family protein [Pseudomonadales bacterium]
MDVKPEELYERTIGRLPPEIAERIALGMEVDPELTRLFEAIRIHVMEPEALDVKTVQLLLFGMMATRLASAPIRYHADAAKRAGASREELYAVAGLALLTGGMRSYNEAGAAIAAAFRDDGSI